jgi:phosphate transport system substrate-binding protein
VLAPGPDPYQTIVKPIQADLESKTGIKLEIVGTDGIPSPNSVIALNKGLADACLQGADWDLLAKVVAEKEPKFNKADFEVREAGKLPTYFITHKGIENKLTADDIYKIFTGKVNNWKEIGGPDLEIKIAIPDKFEYTRKLVATKLMKGEAYRSKIKLTSSFPETLDFVKTNPGAIAFGPASIAGPVVNISHFPEVDRAVIFITKGKPSAKAEKVYNHIAEFMKSKKN